MIDSKTKEKFKIGWIKVENISKSYGNVKALQDISFSSDASVLGLIGPNGAGKTTLIKILSGLIKTDTGNGFLLDNHVWNDRTIIKPHIGVMLEQDVFPSNYKVQEYLNFVCDLYGVTKKSRNIVDWCERLDLPINRNISALSAGMKRKLSLLRAIIPHTKIIILDEPTANVDPLGRETILSLILQLKKQRDAKIIVSSHLLFDLEKIADEIVILRKGRILEKGSTMKIVQGYSKTNLYKCTVQEMGDFIEILKSQTWVINVKDEGNTILIESSSNDQIWVFEQIIKLIKKQQFHLISLNIHSDLLHILRRNIDD